MSTSLKRALARGSGLTGPLGSALSPCTARYRPASLVYIIDSEGYWLHQKLGTGIITLCIVEHRYTKDGSLYALGIN